MEVDPRRGILTLPLGGEIVSEFLRGDRVSAKPFRGFPGGGLPDGDGLSGLGEAAGSEFAERRDDEGVTFAEGGDLGLRVPSGEDR